MIAAVALRDLQSGITGRRVELLCEAVSNTKSSELSDATLYPGFFNAHDHLDFNLFAALKTRTYGDWLEWGEDVQRSFRRQIKRVIAIPHEQRAAIGQLKCLLNGVTTVVDHSAKAALDTPELSVWRAFRFLHSVHECGRWGMRTWKLSSWCWSAQRPLMVHLCEGTSERAAGEWDTLMRYKPHRVPLWAVHGIAIAPANLRKLAGLVWCPGSNRFLYGATTDITLVPDEVPVVLGTDATISGSWSWFDHVRAALDTGAWNSKALAQHLWDVPITSLTGRPVPSEPGVEPAGDWVVLAGVSDEPGHVLSHGTPEKVLLVIKHGRIVMFDNEIKELLGEPPGFVAVRNGSTIKWIPERFRKTLVGVQALRDSAPHIPALAL